MNKDIAINEASGVGYTVDIFRLHTTHLRVKIKRIIYFLYNDIAAILNFLILVMLFTI